MIYIPILTTKSGLPAAWQYVDRYFDSVCLRIIRGPHGEKPIVVPTRRPRHPFPFDSDLTILDVGYYMIYISLNIENVSVSIYKIIKIEIHYKIVTVEEVARFSQGKWNNPPPECLTDTIETIIKKIKAHFEKMQAKQEGSF